MYMYVICFDVVDNKVLNTKIIAEQNILFYILKLIIATQVSRLIQDSVMPFLGTRKYNVLVL